MLRKNVKSLLEQFQVCIFAEIVFGVRCTLNRSSVIIVIFFLLGISVQGGKVHMVNPM